MSRGKRHPAPCHPERLHCARGLCRPCWKKLYDSEQKEHNRIYKKEYRQQHAKRLYEQNKEYREDNPNFLYNWWIKHAYGLSPDQYYKLLDRQNGACAICQTSKPYRLHVDHDHTTNRVRGLLCAKCNGSVEWYMKYSNGTAAYLADESFDGRLL